MDNKTRRDLEMVYISDDEVFEEQNREFVKTCFQILCECS